MEFRYALTTLRIPVIVAVVGTGYEWERSEVSRSFTNHACEFSVSRILDLFIKLFVGH